jgi:predicted polyphosphate/ATP-dependent NAD kinase
MVVDAPTRRFRMGFLVNPVAGLGGPPGHKGSDEPETTAQILAETDIEELPAYTRSMDFLTDLRLLKGVAVTAPGPLGEQILKKTMSCGGPIFEITREAGWRKNLGETSAEDTRLFARRMLREELDLLVFVGGDGTAVDIALEIGDKIPILGVPAGVKMFSGVFAETPLVARSLVQELRSGFATRPVEIVDLDEESYRTGQWNVRGFAHARVPESPGVQVAKGGTIPSEDESLEDLVLWFKQTVRPGHTYVLGAGTTTGALKRALGGGTPLGVDVVRDGQFIETDAGDQKILAAIGDSGTTVIVSPTSPQGAVLGRGTAQISPEVLSRVGTDHVIIIATPRKLVGIQHLFVDTGDPGLDAKFPDYVKVRTDPLTEKVFKLRKGGKP